MGSGLLRHKHTAGCLNRPHGQHAVVLAEDAHRFTAYRTDHRGDHLSGVNPSSRQIYLTFPAESTFTEEDVTSHFRCRAHNNASVYCSLIPSIGAFLHHFSKVAISATTEHWNLTPDPSVLWLFFFLLLQSLWASARCPDPVSTEANVWFCDLCILRDCDSNFDRRKSSLHLWGSSSCEALPRERQAW